MGFLVIDSVDQVSLNTALSYNFCVTIFAFRIVKRWITELERNKGNKENALKHATEGIDCENTRNNNLLVISQINVNLSISNVLSRGR